MTYRTHHPCSVLYHLKRFVRRAIWKRIKPIGQLTSCSYSAVRVHFCEGKY